MIIVYILHTGDDYLKSEAPMLLVVIFAHTALLFLVPIIAVPYKTRGLNPAAVLYVHQSPSQLGSRGAVFNANRPEVELECLENNSGLKLAALAKDCATVLDDAILRIDEPLRKRGFIRHTHTDSNGHWAPAQWASGQCHIYTCSRQSGLADRFSLFDLGLKVNSVLSDRILNHEKGKGGLLSIGSPKKSFGVRVQRSLADTNVNGVNDPAIAALPDTGTDISTQNLDAKAVVRDQTRPQRRELNSSPAPIPLNKAHSPSNLTRNLKTHEIDCFPPRTSLPTIVPDDCTFIINNIILSMNNPFRIRTWGFSDDVDINLSSPDYSMWAFKSCAIRIRNLNESQVDSFRPVDVAGLAQRIVQNCVTDAKEPLGGNADIGNLPGPVSFYVVISGSAIPSGRRPGNSIVLSLPSDPPRNVESRGTMTLPLETLSPSIVPEGLKAGRIYPVHCFDPTLTERLKPAVVADCAVIINEMIPRLPNPFRRQTFGYTDAEDINLSEKENSQWVYGQCAVFIRSLDRQGRDVFRFVDVALTANRIVQECVEGSKYAIGGTADIGVLEDNLYVGVGGLGIPNGGNGTILVSASKAVVSLPSGQIPASTS